VRCTLQAEAAAVDAIDNTMLAGTNANFIFQEDQNANISHSQPVLAKLAVVCLVA